MTTQLTDQDRRERAPATIHRPDAPLLTDGMGVFTDQWTSDGHPRFPSAPPGWPQLASREAVRRHLSGYTDMDIRGIGHQTRHDSSDSDILIIDLLLQAGHEAAFTGALAARDEASRAGEQAGLTDAVERPTSLRRPFFAEYTAANEGGGA